MDAASGISIERKPSRAAVTALLEAASLPTSDLTDAHMDHFFYAGPDVRPTAAVGLEILGKHALLRSLVVSADQRGSGLGTALLQRAERHARAIGVRAIYLLTTTAAPFFAKHGYEAAERRSAPDAIRQTREFAALCPASSAFMIKHLENEGTPR